MSVLNGEYVPKNIEKKWQTYWEEEKTFKAHDLTCKPKYYILDMFPYPSGDGLHVGHPEGYTATDIIARYKRMRGFNVLHPMGWDAFGLPAEQHAVKTGTHPATTTKRNIKTFKKQIQSMGMSYDWDREINTTDPDYYRWTQWIFIQLYQQGLAYESHAPVNWCEELGTVLANEEVIDGKSEVGGFPVIKKPMRQWVLKITNYAERLLEDLDGLEWPEAIKEQQRNWIGRSEGAEISFKIKGHEDEIVTVFTTRPDTLFGASFFVLAPEHALVPKITATHEKPAVQAYVDQATRRSERDRIANTEKTGVFTGAYAINPATEDLIPIYIADYVLISYGHGAIMAVPGHDERDHEFARKYGIGIKRVLTGGVEDITAKAHVGEGTLVNSGFLDGLSKDAAIKKMNDWLAERGIGQKSITFKLRDWLFSRQRYWGEPMPLVQDKDGNTHVLAEADLPVLLPDVEQYKPAATGESPLANAHEWLYFEKNGQVYKRETNTMPQWAGSCWYYLRYLDPNNKDAAWDKNKEQYWMPVDLYVGGAEHAVLHLLYARFWHKVLFDLGYVSTKEPFQKLVNQGMILGENGEKMSKSRGNVVNPDLVIDEWGADSFRLYEMFMGPLEATKPWQTNGIVGCNRFLRKAWRLIVNEETGKCSAAISRDPDRDLLTKMVHKTIKKVTEDLEALRFNTAISTMMELVNQAQKEDHLNQETAKSLILLLSPFAPHIAEELWRIVGETDTLAYHSWPMYEEKYTSEDTITISIQVNGKFRGTIDVSKSASKDCIIEKAKQQDSTARHLADKVILKEIFVPNKIVNFIVK